MTHQEQLWMTKSALIADNLGEAVGNRFGKGWGMAANIGSSFLPGVASVDSAHDAFRNVGEAATAFGEHNWGKGLMGMGKALGNTAIAGVGLLPGMGGAAAKFMKGIGGAIPRAARWGAKATGMSKALPGLSSLGSRAMNTAGRVGGIGGKPIDMMGHMADRVGEGVWNKAAPKFTQRYKAWDISHPFTTGSVTGASEFGMRHGMGRVEQRQEQGLADTNNMWRNMGDANPGYAPDPVEQQPGGNWREALGNVGGMLTPNFGN